MTAEDSVRTKARMLYGGIIVAWLVYASFSLWAPVTGSRTLGLTGFQTVILRLSVVLPILVIWLLAARGAVNFKRYAKLIQGSPEAPAISGIANGLVWAMVYLVGLALPGAATQLFANSSQVAALVALQAYVPLILSMIAFILIYRGSDRLSSIAKFSTWTPRVIAVGVVYVVFSGVFALIVSQHPELLGRDTSSIAITHFFSPSQLIFSLLLPYLLMWFLGLIASINIAKYSRNVSGVIYRRALQNVVLGILGVIVFAVVLQFLTLFSSVFNNLSLPKILLVLYLLVLLYGVGFAFIASGAKKLARIEAAQ